MDAETTTETEVPRIEAKVPISARSNHKVWFVEAERPLFATTETEVPRIEA